MLKGKNSCLSSIIPNCITQILEQILKMVISEAQTFDYESYNLNSLFLRKKPFRYFLFGISQGSFHMLLIKVSTNASNSFSALHNQSNLLVKVVLFD